MKHASCGEGRDLYRLWQPRRDLQAVLQLNEEIEKAAVIDEEGCGIAGCCEAVEENCPVSAITLE